MDKTDEQIQKIKNPWIREYEENPKLKAQFESVQDYLKSKIQADDYRAEFEKSPDLQAEFGSLEVYVAYREAESKGLVRIIGNK